MSNGKTPRPKKSSATVRSKTFSDCSNALVASLAEPESAVTMQLVWAGLCFQQKLALLVRTISKPELISEAQGRRKERPLKSCVEWNAKTENQQLIPNPVLASQVRQERCP